MPKIICKKPLDHFKKGDAVPNGYWESDHLTKLVLADRVVVLDDEKGEEMEPVVYPDFDLMTLAELKACAREYGISIGKAGKIQYIEALKAHANL